MSLSRYPYCSIAFIVNSYNLDGLDIEPKNILRYPFCYYNPFATVLPRSCSIKCCFMLQDAHLGI